MDRDAELAEINQYIRRNGTRRCKPAFCAPTLSANVVDERQRIAAIAVERGLTPRQFMRIWWDSVRQRNGR